jgi:hypothetical protein
MNAKFCSLLFLIVYSLIVANAQSGGPYEVKQSSVAGGGSTLLAGGPYAVHSTIGQKQGSNLSGGIFSTVGGFLVPRVAGDVNGDFCVDDADLLAVLFVFGQSGTLLEDLNSDGIVDDSDLLEVLFHFGDGCP